jgi:hypothetical protein
MTLQRPKPMKEPLLTELKELLQEKLRAFGTTVRRISETYKRLRAWLPIILKDRDWDYAYLFKTIEFKLEQMEKCLSICKHHDHGHDLKRLRTTRLLMKRLGEDNYFENQWEKYDAKFEAHRAFEFEPCPDRPGYSTLKKRPDDEEYGAALSDCMRREEYSKKQDLETFGKCLKKYVYRWWC